MSSTRKGNTNGTTGLNKNNQVLIMGMLLVTQAVPALLVAVIALTVVAAVLGASPEENRYGLVRRKLVGTGNLTTTATTSNEDKYNQARLDSLCDLGSDSYSHDVKRANLDFEFWYAIGTTNGVSMVDARKLFEVEQLLYTSIHENVLWCTAIISGPNATGAGIGNRRRERQLLPTPRLGPVTFTPGITDTVTECTYYHSKDLPRIHALHQSFPAPSSKLTLVFFCCVFFHMGKQMTAQQVASNS